MFFKSNLILAISIKTFFFGIFPILTINIPGLESLKYEDNLQLDDNLIQLNRTFSVVFPLLTSTSVVCIFIENEEFLTVITKNLRQFNTLIFNNLLQNNFKLCNSIIAVDLYGSPYCFNNFVNIYTSNIYIFNLILETNISNLENCSNFESSPEVVAISLSDGSVHELSPVFPRPRLFRRSSIVEVLKHRAQPAKLDLAGSTFTVATYPIFPFFIVKDLEKGEFDGIEEHVINEMSKQLNFSPSFLITDGWGELMPNGTWVGSLMTAMEDGSVELAIGNFWQIHSLFRVLDFGPSMSTVELGFIVRRPKRIDFQWTSVLTIFQPWVWLGSLISFVLVVLFYWAGINCDLHSHSESWPGSIITVLGHLLMTTSHRRVREGNTRHTLTSWSVFSLLLTTSLSTGIVSRLTLPQYEARIDTIRQLVEGNYYWSIRYYILFRPNEMMREFMFDFEDPWATAFENSYLFLETNDILNRVETDSKIAIAVEKYKDFIYMDIEQITENKATKEFRFCKEPNSRTHVSIGFKKKSQLIEPLSVLNLQFLQAGLLDHWKDEVVRRWPQYDTTHLSLERDIPTIGEPEPLLLDKLRPVFYLLLFGLAIASLVFVVEVRLVHYLSINEI